MPFMQEGIKEAFKYKDPAEFTYAFYPGLTEQEARREITTKLNRLNFMVNASKFDISKIEEALGEDEIPSNLIAAAIESGMVIVNAHYDGTSKTGKIYNGLPVCLDYNNGSCVTGINGTWGADEYKVVGIAWKGHESDGFKRIPITLVHFQDAISDDGAAGSMHRSYATSGQIINGTPAQPVVLDGNSVAGGVTYNASNDSLVVSKEGLYDISASASFWIVDSTTIVRYGKLMAYINGSPEPNTFAFASPPPAPTSGSGFGEKHKACASFCFCRNLQPNDYVQLWIQSGSGLQLNIETAMLKISLAV